MPLRRADELLAALLARQQAAPILEKTTGLPYGWALWLRALTPLPRPFHARDVIEVLLPRPQPAAPGRLPALGFAQALRRLFWQGWDPPPRDQRWMRWVASLTSALLHVLFFVLLLWVALIRPPVKEQEGGEGERVQIEFLGQGAQEGGGDQPGAAEAIAAAANAAAAAAQAEAEAAGWATPTPPSRTPPTAQATPAPTTPAPAAAPPSPAEPAVAAEPLPTPPVQATEVAEASTDFVVPPVSAVRTEVRVVPRAQDTPVVRERSVQTVEAPRVPAPVVTPQVRVPQREVQAPQVREREIAQVDPAPAVQAVRPADVQVRTPQRELQVQEREVQVVSTESVQMARVAVREPGARDRPSPQVAVREPGARDRPSPQVAVRERTVTAREPAPAASSATAASAPAPNASAATPASGSAAAPANASTARSAAQAGQAGARPTPTPGNWATPARGDDWGASSHERPGSSHGAQAASGGQGAGLFNADGSVRVPGQEGAAQSPRGAPGGDNDGWTKDRIAQSGTWLKRPPYDYTPTSFDKYWVPQESLLAEWVRKGIKAMEIPLPGTSTRISCVISILQAGGGCGLTDPNMQDQPAIARPPPDIPFKKELQEDNGSR